MVHLKGLSPFNNCMKNIIRECKPQISILVYVWTNINSNISHNHIKFIIEVFHLVCFVFDWLHSPNYHIKFIKVMVNNKCKDWLCLNASQIWPKNDWFHAHDIQRSWYKIFKILQTMDFPSSNPHGWSM